MVKSCLKPLRRTQRVKSRRISKSAPPVFSQSAASRHRRSRRGMLAQLTSPSQVTGELETKSTAANSETQRRPKPKHKTQSQVRHAANHIICTESKHHYFRGRNTSSLYRTAFKILMFLELPQNLISPETKWTRRLWAGRLIFHATT